MGVRTERYVIGGDSREAVMMRGGSGMDRSILDSIKLPVVPSRARQGIGAKGVTATCATGAVKGAFFGWSDAFTSCPTLMVWDLPQAPKRAYAFLLIGEELAVRRRALSLKASWL